MKRFLLLCVLAVSLAAEERVDLEAVHRIRQEGLQRSKVMDHAFQLTDVYGPRLTGSPGLKAAGEWIVRKFEEWGLINAKLEPWGPFGRGWSAAKFSAHLKEPQYAPLIGFPRPWSPGTNGPVAGTPLLAVIRTEADFAKFKGKLKGKIVLADEPRALRLLSDPLNRVYNDSDLNRLTSSLGTPGNPYQSSVFVEERPAAARAPRGEKARRFTNKLNQFLKDEGVVAVLTTGDTTDGGTVRGTGPGHLRDSANQLPPPTVALTPEHYNRIARLLDRKVPVTIELDIDTRFHEETKDSFNAVGEIPGTDRKDEIVMIGAHMDSWTGGTGATDNAAGTSVVLEAMRILKASGLKPRRTIRASLWTGEEQGLLGSRAYVAKHFADPENMELKPEHAKLAAYFNLDNGSGMIRGVYLQENDMVRPIFEAWLEPFKDLGANALATRKTTGTDHLSFDAVGLPGFQFIQDPLEYSTRTHHSNMDVYDRLQRNHLQQAAVIMASFAYHAAIREQGLPRKPLPEPKVSSGLKNDIPYTKVGTDTLTLDAYIPDGDGPFPAAVIVHGGGFINGDKQTYVPPLFEPLVNADIAYFTINYRLSPQAKYPAPVEDVERAVKWVRDNAKRLKVDPERIALIGESAGGTLVSMAGVRNKPESRVRAVVAFYGMHDVEMRVAAAGISENIRAFTGITELTDATRAKFRDMSPATHVKSDTPPFLLIHGTKDAQVPYEQSTRMCDAMKAAGASCELFTVEGAPHGVGPWEKTPEFQKYKQKMTAWLKETMQ